MFFHPLGARDGIGVVHYRINPLHRTLGASVLLGFFRVSVGIEF